MFSSVNDSEYIKTRFPSLKALIRLSRINLSIVFVETFRYLAASKRLKNFTEVDVLSIDIYFNTAAQVYE
jgi:hypothetical protein